MRTLEERVAALETEVMMLRRILASQAGRALAVLGADDVDGEGAG